VHKMSAFHREMKASIDGSERLFPIDVDLSEVDSREGDNISARHCRLR
jgi:hypothetical protein